MIRISTEACLREKRMESICLQYTDFLNELKMMRSLFSPLLCATRLSVVALSMQVPQ